MHGSLDISIDLVRRLVTEQFPQWADLPIRHVDVDGFDNRTFRLGDAMSVRLPSSELYAPQVAKEQRWLPRLAPLLPLPIPTPIAVGVPGCNYPWAWSVYPWLDGEVATPERIGDLSLFARSLAGFLLALQRINPADGPAPGPHNFFRGAPLALYDAQTRQAILALAGEIDEAGAIQVWDAALQAEWRGAPVWVHGDVARGNLLVENGRLSAVIDFGSSAVGDPACDMTVAWTLLGGRSRDAFRTTLAVDPGTWARGRGWALWKALITVAGAEGPDSKAMARRVLADVIADHCDSP